MAVGEARIGISLVCSAHKRSVAVKQLLRHTPFPILDDGGLHHRIDVLGQSLYPSSWPLEERDGGVVEMLGGRVARLDYVVKSLEALKLDVGWTVGS